MTDTVVIAIIGVIGTLLGSGLGMFGNKVLENSRARNERQLYIGRARFNREFDMYQDLCEKHLTMVYDIGTAVMITRGSSLPEGVETNHDFVMLSAQHIDDADMQNKRCAPFISKEIFEKYKELGKSAYSAISLFDLWCRFDETGARCIKYNQKDYTKDNARIELEEKQKELSHCSDLILEKIRNHLNAEGRE